MKGESRSMEGRGKDGVRRAREWLEWTKCLAEREGTHEQFALAGLRFGRAERGHFVFSLTVPKSATVCLLSLSNHITWTHSFGSWEGKDSEGSWSRGAMATLMDDLSAAAVISCDLPTKVSVDFSISYFSEVAAKEEVEIECRALAHKGKLSAVVVEIRKKASGEPVALGRQWMAATSKI